MPGKTPIVMISSTFRDLHEHRQGVLESCLRQGMLPKMMEHLSASDEGGLTESLRLVDESDIYLGIFGHRYGFVPKGKMKSITHYEYERATSRGIPRLIFIMHDDHRIKAADVDKGENAEKLEQFKQQLQVVHTVNYFKSPEELHAQVASSLAAVKKKIPIDLSAGAGECSSSLDNISEIPTPPLPYVAHEYTLLVNRKGLIGRQDELKRLTDWLMSHSSADEARIFCVIAIGGMGKSALTWHWSSEVGRYLAPVGVGFSGSVWWSFYESGATYRNFILHTLAYASGNSLKHFAERPLSECEDLLLRALDQVPYLVVLDGLERILNAYADPASIYRRDDDQAEFETDVRPRLTIDIKVGRFLRRLAKVGASRILISSRLYPAALEDAAGQPIKGSYRFNLSGLSETDALALWDSFGLSGSAPSLLAFFATFHRHPLLIQALASVVARDRRANRNFDVWRALHPDFDVFSLPIKQVRTHILELAMKGLSERELYTLHVIAGVRSPIAFETLSSLLVGSDTRQFADEPALIEALERLEETGLLGWDNRPGINRYDLHPIVRGVAWSRLEATEKDGIFERLQHYFEVIPSRPAHQVLCLDDLTPALELFHALASRGHFEQAHNIFVERLMNQLDRIGANTTYLGLLSQLFPGGWDNQPQVSDARCLFQRVSNKFAGIGELSQAMAMHARHNELCDELACTLTDVYFLHATGKLKNAIAELNILFTRVTRAAVERSEVSTFINPLLQALMNYAEVSYDCGDLKTCQLADNLISKIFWERWNATDSVFQEHLHCDTFGDTRYLYDRAMRRANYKRAARRADHLWRLAMTRGGEGFRIEASLLQAAARVKLNELDSAKERLGYSRLHAKAVGSLPAEVLASTMLAEVELGLGNLDPAFAALEEIWELFDRAPYRLLHAEAMNIKAAIYTAAGDLASAAASARRAHELAWCDGPPYAYHPELVKARQHCVRLGLPEASLFTDDTGMEHCTLSLNLTFTTAIWQTLKAERLARETTRNPR